MRMESIERRIAYFISPHGFGHAARASAVMEAACSIDLNLRFEIFTSVPQWFFQQSLTRRFGYHSLQTDLGLVQRTPLVVDLAETLRRLDGMLPFDASAIERLAREIRTMRCEMVVSDIAPMGIKVAEAARLPSVLIENFTWDWIYEEYASEDSRIQAHADYLRTVFCNAQYHIQTEPVCAPAERAALRTPPISREPRTPGRVIRERLGIPSGASCVLITMGGIPNKLPFINTLERARHIFFVIPGGSQTEVLRDNLVLLPHASDFYHPDLVNAADCVVGKIGYSTLAEAFHAGVPFCYVMRRGFREAAVLANFVDEEMHGRALSEEDFTHTRWLQLLDEMLAWPRVTFNHPNGALDVAEFLVTLLKGKS